MKIIHSIMTTFTLSMFAQHAMAISKAYNEDLEVTVIEGEPCFYLKNNNFNNRKKDYVDFLIDIYITGSTTESVFSEKKSIKTPRDKNSCISLSSLNETSLKPTWQQNKPYILFLSDGTVYHSEFCLKDNKVFAVENIPDPKGVNNATKRCTSIAISEPPRNQNKLLNWLLKLFS